VGKMGVVQGAYRKMTIHFPGLHNPLKTTPDKAKKKLTMLIHYQHPALFLQPNQDIFPH
jgi:hypothetical protein